MPPDARGRWALPSLLLLAALAPVGAELDIVGKTCVATMPHEIFLDLPNAVITNNNIGGVREPDNDDHSLRLEGAVTANSYDIINSLPENQAHSTWITRVDMVLTIADGGNYMYQTTGRAEATVSESDSGERQFINIHQDNPGGGNGQCGSSDCISDFQIQFVVATCSGSPCAVGTPITIPAMEFSFFDFDQNTRSGTGQECLRAWDWDAYALSGVFIEQSNNNNGHSDCALQCLHEIAFPRYN